MKEFIIIALINIGQGGAKMSKPIPIPPLMWSEENLHEVKWGGAGQGGVWQNCHP